jgi:photosystem II stability/assembly factor-like uncharacterized protein
MSFIKSCLLVCCILFLQQAIAQPSVKILESGKRISIRGLSVVNDNVIWASGSSGSVARSVDGGNTFTWITVPGYEKNDFRDIEAFDANTAIIMAITTPAAILKTTDGGKNWRKVFEDTTKGAFFDAMDFADAKHGVLIGDPLGSTVYAATTSDNGDSWKKTDWSAANENMFGANEGEAFFASSGTNIKLLDAGFHLAFVSGGKSSRLFINGNRDLLPIMQGKESTGANSIAVYKNKKAVIVGGDFSKDTISTNNCVLVSLKDETMLSPQTPPHGYRSSVIYLDEKNLLTCGTSGIDISKDGGMNWELISTNSFHVCQKAKKGKAIFLAGGGGRIAKLILP